MLCLGSWPAEWEPKVNANNRPRQLRIAIATFGRFHVLDLARELSALGHDVRFYSYVPRMRAIRFGLPKRCHVSLLVLLWPLVAMSRVFRKGRTAAAVEKLLQLAANAVSRASQINQPTSKATVDPNASRAYR